MDFWGHLSHGNAFLKILVFDFMASFSKTTLETRMQRRAGTMNSTTWRTGAPKAQNSCRFLCCVSCQENACSPCGVAIFIGLHNDFSCRVDDGRFLVNAAPSTLPLKPLRRAAFFLMMFCITKNIRATAVALIFGLFQCIDFVLFQKCL